MTQAQRVARRWAYIGILAGGVASVAGNVASTVLTESAVSLWLRVPWAVLWPVLTYIGIEVLTRTEWKRGFSHYGARAVLIGPVSLVAAFVSYLHLHHLMVVSGEPGLAQAVGPLAVDGTLFGCTVVLLITGRLVQEKDVAAATAQASTVPATVPVRPPAAWEAYPLRQQPAPTHTLLAYGPHPEIEAPAPTATRARTQRNGSWDRERAAELIREGKMKDAEIGAEVGTGYKTIQRYRKFIAESDAQERELQETAL
jgi:hypothetical protein